MASAVTVVCLKKTMKLIMLVMYSHRTSPNERNVSQTVNCKELQFKVPGL